MKPVIAVVFLKQFINEMMTHSPYSFIRFIPFFLLLNLIFWSLVVVPNGTSKMKNKKRFSLFILDVLHPNGMKNEVKNEIIILFSILIPPPIRTTENKNELTYRWLIVAIIHLGE